MTREHKIDITLEELGREITMATYQEKGVRKCLAAAFTRIERETAVGNDPIAALKELYGFYVSDIRYGEKDQGLPVSKAENGLHGLIEGHFNHAVRIEAENLLTDAMADYEQQGFINGFRYATTIWKAC